MSALLTFAPTHPCPFLPTPKPPAPRPRLRLTSPHVAATPNSTAHCAASNDRLRGLVRRGDLDEALRLVETMADHESSTTAGPCATLIKKLYSSGHTVEARRVLAAYQPDVMAYDTMVVGYYSTGQLDAARWLVVDMPMEPDARASAVGFDLAAASAATYGGGAGYHREWRA